MQVSQAKKLKDLERENARLKRLVADQSLDNGSEFTALAVRDWLQRLGVTTLFIESGSPWENGYNERSNGKLRDELLNGEILYTLREAQILVERWRRHYNEVRPHSSLGYKPPALQTRRPMHNWVFADRSNKAISMTL